MKLIPLIWEMRHPITFIHSYIRMPMRLFLSQVYESSLRKTSDSVLSLKEILFKAGVIALITSCVVWVSVFLYVAFYYSYMPNITHSRPVHLKYKSCDADKGICSFPSSHVELTRRHNLLMVGQPYRIKLLLEMPESEVNKEVGMFLCCMELRTRGGHLVSESCRSAMLPYRSHLLTFMMTMFYSPLLVSGIREERRTVELELFFDYEDDQDTPATDVYIEIQSRHVQIYSAMLVIEAHFTGLRYIMFHWPMLSAVVGISTNLLFVAFVCALSWYHLQLGAEDKEILQGSLNEDVDKPCDDKFLFDLDEFQQSLSIKEDKNDFDTSSDKSSTSLFDDPLTGASAHTLSIKKELESQA